MSKNESEADYESLKISNRGVKLSHGKGLAGKARVTDGKIDILQNYYGLAVRENSNDVRRSTQKMAVGIQAVLYYGASTDANPQQSLCGYKREKDTY